MKECKHTKAKYTHTCGIKVFYCPSCNSRVYLEEDFERFKLIDEGLKVRDITAVKEFILSKVQYGVLYSPRNLFKIGKGLYGVRDCEVYSAIANIRMKGGMYYNKINPQRGYFWKI